MTNIFSNRYASLIIMLVMMIGGSVGTWADEKVIYSTDFQDWAKSDYNRNPDIPVKIDKTTADGQTLTFSLNNTVVEPDTIYTDKGVTYGKIKNTIVTRGWLNGFKNKKEENGNGTDAYIETSVLRNVTKVSFVQGATGGKTDRGWNVAYRVEGETEWTTIYDTPIGTTDGSTHLVTINKENVQLRFFNRKPSEMAFVTSLEIYGNVDPVNTVKVAYYDTDGTSLIGENPISTDGDAKYPKLTYRYGANDATVANGNVFRGWFNGTGPKAVKVKEGTELYSGMNLYAKATPKEEPTDGTEYSYEMRVSSWDPDDHDVISINNGAYTGIHGWLISGKGSFKIDVASFAEISIKLCGNGSGGNTTVTDSNGNTIATFASKQGEDIVSTVSYQGGEPTTLTFTVSADTYIHSINIVNFRPVWATFKFANDKIEGVCPDAIRGNNQNEITMPKNVYFYRPGWTFQGWTDGTNTYDKGKTYTFSDNIALYPKFIENTFDLTETDISTVTWSFDYTKAPVLNSTGASTPTIYTNSVLVTDETQDIALTINTKNGGINNTNEKQNKLEGEGAAVSNGTVFKVRAIYGMTVTIHASDKVDDENGNNTTVFGTGVNDAKFTLSEADMANTTYTIEDEGKTITMVYHGDATTLEFTADKLGSNDVYGFIKDITVKYAMLPDVWVKGFIQDKDVTKYPNEKDGNAGTAQVLSTTQYPNTGNRYKLGDELTIVATPAYGYKVIGYRENISGTIKDLPTKEYTDPETGDKKLAADYTVVNNWQTIIEAVYERLPLFKVAVTPSDASLGQVSLSPVYDNFYNEIYETNEDGTQGSKTAIECWYTEGTQVTAMAEAATEYVVENWKEEGIENTITEDNSYSFTVSAAHSFIVNFRQGNRGTVYFDLTDAHVSGESVAAGHHNAISTKMEPIEDVRSFTVPTNYTFFKDVDDKDLMTDNSYTLLYWVDKEEHGNIYEIGKTYSFKKNKITLIPVFTYNPAPRTNRVNNPLIRYDFGCKQYSYYDPTSGQQRITCAQQVNIKNDMNTFWTAQGYFEVLDNGQTIGHTRDVALEISTGKNGYIRNEDLGDWCAFGPGTTLWCTSSVGTKVSILTYSKVTDTTIDGVVPTLDEERTATEREIAGNDHVYVYTYTTQNSATRMPIVIGDDYSYYQWIEVSMRAANMVNLHVGVDDSKHGSMTDVESLSNYGATELEDGGYAFRQGDRVRMTFSRKFGYEFDKLVSTSHIDADGNPLQLIKMKDDGSVDMVDENQIIHNVPRNADGTWGTASGDGETVFTLKIIEPTDAAAKAGERTTYEVEYDITAHRTIEVVFKERSTYYITYNPGELASGIAPVAQWVEAGDKFTAHNNRTLYYEGNTLAYWVDADYDESMPDDEKEKHIYETGKDYTAPAMDLRLYPVFQPNSFNVLDIDKEHTATWYFAKDDGAPEINYESTAGILVTQLQSGDKHIDLKIDLDATDHGNGKGKFNNTSSGERIQINANSIINFTSTPGCEVLFSVVSKDPSSAMVAGKKLGDEGYTLSADKKSVSVVCSGDTAVQQLTLVNDGVYGKLFAVTYKPQTAQKATIESLSCGETTYDAAEIKRQIEADGYVTFHVSPWESTNEEIPSVTGTATESGMVLTTKATVTTPQATATVRTATGITLETYPIEFVFNTPEDFPVFQKVEVNGVTKSETTNTFDGVPNSGIINVTFNRTMAKTTIKIDELGIETTAEAGKTLSFKYWNLPDGSSIRLYSSPEKELFKDIYGKALQQPLTLILNVKGNSQEYNHSTFDFVVGVDGNMDDAIAAANSNTKPDGERYYIFVPDGEWKLEGNAGNGKTDIKKPNISLIGQSKEGTTVWNEPINEGISITATIYIDRNLTDFYCEDITLQNRYDYLNTQGGAGRAVVFNDRGTRSIMKNVALNSYQDTYYSNNANPGFRGYFENCDIYGVVDFLCGDGDIWLEKCNLIMHERSGNNICAPGQKPGVHEWGYVFNNCTIKPEIENSQLVTNNNWTLARPWTDSPAVTYLNTTMITQPTNAGWQRMTTDLILRMHEYRSKDANGNLLSLGQRSLASCAPGVGSDDCVLTAAQAAQYTLRNVVGGTDGFEPDQLCKQLDAASASERDENSMTWNDNINLDDNDLIWDADPRALCYFVFKQNDDGKWIYQGNTTETSFNLSESGTGSYCVRAANQRGGLGAATKVVDFTIQDPYELVIKQLGDLTVDGVPYGWSTICLPFNAKVPEEVTAYAATAYVSPASKTTVQNAGKSDDSDADREALNDDKVKEFLMTLTPVTVINGTMGYVVYGPAGSHNFAPTSRTNDEQTILTGNSTRLAMSTVNNPGYVLANKNWGLGFYKYSGSTYAPFRAWLPQDMVASNVQTALASGTTGIRFSIVDKPTSIVTIRHDSMPDDAIYDLSGRRMKTAATQGVYITKKGKRVFR